MSGECDDCGEHCLDCRCEKLDDNQLVAKMVSMGNMFDAQYQVGGQKIALLMVGASCWFARKSGISLKDYCNALYAMSGVYLQFFWEEEEKKKVKPIKKKTKKARK